ncbi:hypothetical protein RB195_004410 [Necator americanus]|uniref:Uncharacterized protein n=1 Tax=Necator americanus TaxID=51031 RepID=A0ABR1BHW1_NECAM
MSVCLLEGHSGEHVAILCEEYEKLRPTDGRLIKSTDESACRRSSLFPGTGAIDRYNFNFELSRLQLPSGKMQLVQYLPQVYSATNGVGECSRRHGFELTSAEFSEFCDRLAALPVIERGTYKRSRGLALLGQPYDLVNALPQPENFGDIPGSTLSKMIQEYSRGMDVIKKRRKTLFTYSDELVDKKKIEFYESMIEKLDKLLSI